jgi:hypothetical protein
MSAPRLDRAAGALIASPMRVECGDGAHGRAILPDFKRVQKMKYLIAAIVGAGLASPASAQMRCETFGNLQHCNGPGGYNSYQENMGDLTHGYDNRGNGWTTQQFGGQSNTQFYRQPYSNRW